MKNKFTYIFFFLLIIGCSEYEELETIPTYQKNISEIPTDSTKNNLNDNDPPPKDKDANVKKN